MSEASKNHLICFVFLVLYKIQAWQGTRRLKEHSKGRQETCWGGKCCLSGQVNSLCLFTSNEYGVIEAFPIPCPLLIPVAFASLTGRLKVNLLQGLECIHQDKEKLIYSVLAEATSFSLWYPQRASQQSLGSHNCSFNKGMLGTPWAAVLIT